MTLARVNQALIRRSVEARFATAFYGVLGPTGALTYCNAGHNPPLLLRANSVERLEQGGLILGLFEHATFEEATVQLQPGDLLITFSDGVTEAMRSKGPACLGAAHTSSSASPSVLSCTRKSSVRSVRIASRMADE